MTTTDLSNFYISMEESTPVFKARLDGKNSLIIFSSSPKQDLLTAESHRDPSYQASFNRCTSLGCSDYTKGFNHIPSCSECEKPLFPPYEDIPGFTCLASTLLQRINSNINGLTNLNRSANYGGGMPIVDNRIETNLTDYYYSDAYIEYKRYNGQTSPATIGWKEYPGSNGEVSFNKFYSMTGFWFGMGACHGANNLYQCAVSCDSGEVAGCWQVGDLQREDGANPLKTYGEVKFGSVWAFKGFESSYPANVRYYQMYDPAQIVAAGLILTMDVIVPLNPTISTNNYMSADGTGQQSEQAGFNNCKPNRTSIDFGDAEFLRETNCLSGGTKRNSDPRCSLCETNSYKPLRVIDKMLRFADPSAPDYRLTELKDIPVTQFRKLKFSLVGDVVGKIFTDGNNCYFPKTKIDNTVGKFLFGGPTDAVVAEGYKQASYANLGLTQGFVYDDCMSCLEKKAVAAYETISTARTDLLRLSPFYGKCGVDIAGKDEAFRLSSGHLAYNIDCKCVRCGDVYITGAPYWKNTGGNGTWKISEPSNTPITENAALFSSNLPQKRKLLAVIDQVQVYTDDPVCVPSINPLPSENPDFPFASHIDPDCWDCNNSQYKRIWWFFDKSKKFTDLGFRSLVPMSPYWAWARIGSTSALDGTPGSWKWYNHRYHANHLWQPCGGLLDNDRAVVPFCITCFEKMQSRTDALNNIIVSPTLSIVTGIKLASENEFSTEEIAYKGLPTSEPIAANYAKGLPRAYLYYSRRASTSYYPCDNTNAGKCLGTYNCSCSPLPCMDEILLTTVPITYNSSSGVLCSILEPGTSSFPSIYEISTEGTEGITNNPTTDKLYPLIGPNKYVDGIPFRNFQVGLSWDSFKVTRLQPENSTETGAASAYKYQYNNGFANNGYFQNFYVDNYDPLYFWNRPVSFLNSGILIKSHEVTELKESLFRLARLRDAYHITCSRNANGVWGEYGYKTGLNPGVSVYSATNTSGNNTQFSTLKTVVLGGATTYQTPVLYGPVTPNTVIENSQGSQSGWNTDGCGS